MGQARSVWTALIVSAIVLGAAPPVHANPKAAAVHNRQGKAYFDAKQYDEAIGEFKKSYDLERKPITLFKIASAHYAKADYAAAIDYYGRYLQADPEGPYAAQALEFTTIANRALAEDRAKREAADAATRKDAETKAAAAETARKQQAGAARVKNADAFIKAGAWVSAGDEYRAATELDGDSAHLLDAAAAYRKKPDHAKARDAYRAYLEHVSSGPRADEVRVKLAESTRALEVEAAEAEAAARAVPAVRGDAEPTPSRRPFRRGWAAWGLRAGGGASIGNHNPVQNSSQGQVLGKSFDLGVFVRYDLGSRVAVRPELSALYRSASFDGTMQQNAVDIRRKGFAITAPLVLTVKDGWPITRLAVGVFVAVMPFSEASLNEPGTSVGEQNAVDPGLMVAIENGFGPVTVEVAYRKVFAIGGMGEVSEGFATSLQTLTASLAVSFGI